MSRPTSRPDSGNAQFRKRIPASVGDRLKGQTFIVDLPLSISSTDTERFSCRITHEVRLSLRTSSRPLIAVRTLAATAAFERLVSAALKGPDDLSYRDLQWVLGLFYRHLVAEHEANPPQPIKEDGRVVWSPFEVWADIIDDASALASTGKADRRLEALVLLRPLVDVDGLLQVNCVVLSEKSKADLIEALPAVLRKAMWTLQARAAGDYRPDLVAEEFPLKAITGTFALARAERQASSDGQAVAASIKTTTLTELIDKWKTEIDPSASTVSAYNSYRKSLEAFLGHGIAPLITKADALGWKDHLVKLGRKRINTTYLGALASLFAYGVANGETTGLRENPFLGVKARQRSEDNKKVRPFSKAEVTTILTAAIAEPVDAPTHWVPLLLWSTGARVAELTGLHKSSLIVEDGLSCISIQTLEDGNRVKNAASKRVVPLHPDLIELGFLDWVKTRKEGPLFHKPTKESNATVSHPAKSVASAIAAWVRGLGLIDPTISPSHSWRHTLSSELTRENVRERVLAAIQGHTPNGIAAGYTHVDVRMKADALRKLSLDTALGKQSGSSLTGTP